MAAPSRFIGDLAARTSLYAVNVLLLTRALAEISSEERLVREIARLGVSMTVVVPGGRWRGTSNGVLNLIPEGYELTTCDCLFTSIESVRVRSHLYYYPGISRLIQSGDWSLVHADDEAYNFSTFQVVRACVRNRKRVVFTARKSMLQKFPIPFNWFEKYVHRNADAAATGSKDALDVLRRKGFTKFAARIQLGLDPDHFRKSDASALRQEWGLARAFVIGFAGQIVSRKGLDTLLKALALLPEECALVLVGIGQDEPKFKSLAIELNLTARVRWVSWVDHREVAQYMSAFDVFVLPSLTARRWREDFGRVLIEAMACETPVVGSDSGEIPNVIGDAGFIFHEGDERELARYLLRLMEDSSIRESLGRRGRVRVLEQFTYSIVATRTVQFYKSICSGRRRDRNE